VFQSDFRIALAMANILTEITNAAVTIFRAKHSSVLSQNDAFSCFNNPDIVLRNAYIVSIRHPESKNILSEFIKLRFSDPNSKGLFQ
jgi:hypothetical protein